jgi:alpha-N-arabinofuranosidase
MYTPFQEATYLPVDYESETIRVTHEYFKPVDESRPDGYRTLPLVSVSAAKTQEGSLIVSLTNVSLDKAQELNISLKGYNAKTVSGRILTAKNVADFNDFANPNRVAPAEFTGAKLKKGELSVKLPAKSIVVLNVK